MELKQILKDCVKSFGIGTNYQSIHDTIKKYIGINNIEIDINQNLIYTLSKNEKAKNRILIDAHIDEIGFIVTYITDEGFLKVSPVGGISKETLLSQKILVLGKKLLTGVISVKPPHIKSDNSSFNIDDLLVDVGLPKSEVEKFVSISDYCVFNTEINELINNKITSKSLDNRIGVAILIDCIKKLEKLKFEDTEIKFLFSVKEESSHGIGAKTFTQFYKPTEAVVIDVSFSEQLNVDKKKCGKMGYGPMIAFSPNLNYNFIKQFENICNQENIKYQKEILNSTTGSNADYICDCNNGVKTALLSVPIKNMHSPVEIVKIEDIELTSNLLEKYLRSFCKNA